MSLFVYLAAGIPVLLLAREGGYNLSNSIVKDLFAIASWPLALVMALWLVIRG